ncbi:MAG: DegV family protein, partial [Oscillospiraceae bacterium]
MSLEVDGKTYVEYVDNREIKPQEFYQKLREGVVASTSQINVAQFTDAFKKYLEQGFDVLHISFSSGLSGTHNSSCIAASDLQALYPDRKIVSLDSLAASLGQGLLVHYLAKMRDNGATIDELIAWHEENKLSLAHWFTVDDLNFLKRGGRLSGAAAFFGTVLNVKPVLHVDNDGHLIA